MARINPDIDIVADLLKAVLTARPEDAFCKSLWLQYQERGGLSKKQLEGLLGKASAFTDVPAGKLATLEAIILKKHQKHHSPPPTLAAAPVVADTLGDDLSAILQKYATHKRILFLKTKFNNHEQITQAEREEVYRLKKLLLG